jgi:hypothetical protein
MGEHGPSTPGGRTLCGWYFTSTSACPICGAVHDGSYHVATNDKRLTALYCPCSSLARECDASAPCVPGRRCAVHRGLDVTAAGLQKARLTDDDFDALWAETGRVCATAPVEHATASAPPSMRDMLERIRSAGTFREALELLTDASVKGGGLFPSHYRAEYTTVGGVSKPRRVTRIAYTPATGLVIRVDYGDKSFEVKCKRFERPTDAESFELVR